MRSSGRGAWRVFLVGLALASSVPAQPQVPAATGLAKISAESLREKVSFLASDEMEGRATPSPGLDKAAEYLAEQFRKAGLEPIGPGGSFFQEARFGQITPTMDKLAARLVAGEKQIQLETEITSVRALSAVDVEDSPVISLPAKGELPYLGGRIVAGPASVFGTEAGLKRLQAGHPRLILLVSRRKGRTAPSYLEDLDSGLAPVVRVGNEEILEVIATGQALRLAIHVEAPGIEVVKLRNVGGVLRGADPDLREQVVMLTAHYDHVGTRGTGDDHIFNGANDNASGTASVVEIAQALAALPERPKRSVLFLALFGEEKGLLGAYYYTRHPLFPLSRTVAEVNLEQMGRTDDKEGPRIREISFTGPSYSDLPDTMTEAAKGQHVAVFRKDNADAFFARSDNYAFALAGVVAHTLVVAYEYPEYHAPGDEWQKLDYENMAVADRAVAAGILKLASDVKPPRWSDIAATETYRLASPK